NLIEPDDGDLQLTVEIAALVQSERAGPDRNRAALLDTRLGDLDPAAMRLPLLEQDRPWLWREIDGAVHDRAHIGIERLGGEPMQRWCGRAGKPQRHIDRRITSARARRRAPVHLEMIGLEDRGLAAGAEAIDGRAFEHGRDAVHAR